MTHHPEYSSQSHPAVECLLQNCFDGMAQAMALLLNEAMKIERSQALCATPYERTDERSGYANGFKPKTVTTRVGKIELSVPQVRGEVGFYLRNPLTKNGFALYCFMLKFDNDSVKAAMVRDTQVKHTGITAELRREIHEGLMKPGERLPTRVLLEKRFDVSSLTVQRAMENLQRDGFIMSDGRRGTFVAAHPPHLCRYGLVFNERPGGNFWPGYWTALQRVANELSLPEGHSMAVYYGLDTDKSSPLLADVLAHRVAGLIFPDNPYMFRGTPVLDEPGIPRVAFMPVNAGLPVDVWVEFDGRAFIDRALDRLKAEGCHQVAVITVPGLPQEWFAALETALARRQLLTRPYWRLSMALNVPECTRALARLLMAVPGHRPDGLIIADDNLVEPVEAGLIDSGVLVPQDLRIVAHCNFPFPTPSPLPVHRLGYDMHDLLRQAMAQIDRMRSGQSPVACVQVQPVFAEELPAAAATEAIPDMGARAI